MVQVGRIENSEEWLVLAVEEISDVKWKIGETEFATAAAGFSMKKGTDTLYDILKKMIEATMQIVVLQGTSPDYVKLQEALLSTQNLFTDATE